MKFHENRCRQCKKLFCCLKCRLAHEEKKHSPREIKCSICCSKKLQIKGDESHEFICHLVFNHLPLLCRLCGQSFESYKDLKNLQKCGWWKSENSQRVLKILENTLTPTTPEFQVKHYSSDSCSNSDNNNSNRKSVYRSKESSYFVTLNSPPVLIRNTSTPMISNGPKTNFELRKSNSVSLVVKTPRNFFPSLEDTESPLFLDNNKVRRCNSESLFYSGRSNSQSKSFIQSSSTDFYTCEQLDSNAEKRLSLLTKVQEVSDSRSQIKKEAKPSKKTVRFSDQFFPTREMAEYDEFFEARENLSEISQLLDDDDAESEISVNLVESTFNESDNRDNQINVEKENKRFLETRKIYPKKNQVPSESKIASDNISLMISNVYLTDNNFRPKQEEEQVPEANYLQENVCSVKNVYLQENVISKKNVHHQKVVHSGENVYLQRNIVSVKNNRGDDKIAVKIEAGEKSTFDESNNYSQNETSDDENKENELENNHQGSNSLETSSKASSSRIVMMLVVDNASQFSRSDLVPLIDSGLKKLEESSSMSTVYNSISSQSSTSSAQEEKYSLRNSQFKRRSTTSVNSYFSIASSECFTAQNESSLSMNGSRRENTSFENGESSTKSDGILSAVARVVRNALRIFPGASMLQESSESASDESSSFLTESSSQASSPSPLPPLSSSSFSSSSSSSPTTLDQYENHLAIKRPRDTIPTSAMISSPALPNEDRSPIAKRQRGWYKYKVRARPPIARMRKIQVTSPKGISSETQRFQQGSLSVGRLNTIIPLPSRAHQCTQTEK